MNKPELPQNEKSRLLELQSLNILDTPHEKRFDRITRVASKIFNVPIVLVSLVDENRQWFKSAIGFDIDETSRDTSFAAHAILGNKVLMVEDTQQDQRFQSNPLVLSDPNIRFYAGCPLTTIKGNNLGALCLMDNKPRKLNRDQVSILKDLALMVERELELSRLSIVDELTQIPNRRGFMKLAEQSLNLSRRSGLPSTLVSLELNHLKQTNEDLGHSEGDKVLIIFATNIKKISRESDIFARLGSNKFVILFIDTPPKSIERVLLRFKEFFQRHLKLNSLDHGVTFSYSAIEFFPEKHSGIDDMLQEAHERMHLSNNLLD